MSKVQVLSIKQNKIICKVKSKNYKLLLSFCVSLIISFVVLFSFGGSDLQTVGSRMGYVFDPVNSLYSDNGSVIFTSTGFYVAKDKLDFVIPIVCASIQVDENGTISAVADKSIMVKAVESGVVEDVGVSLNGIKYIKIRHSLDVCSELQNVDIVGVKIGDNVKRGSDIATIKQGSVLSLKLYDCEKQIKNLKILESKIVWEK